jgi:hypothetical protein
MLAMAGGPDRPADGLAHDLADRLAKDRTCCGCDGSHGFPACRDAVYRAMPESDLWRMAAGSSVHHVLPAQADQLLGHRCPALADTEIHAVGQHVNTASCQAGRCRVTYAGPSSPPRGLGDSKRYP